MKMKFIGNFMSYNGFNIILDTDAGKDREKESEKEMLRWRAGEKEMWKVHCIWQT